MFVLTINVVLVLVNYVLGLVVTSSVMEVEAASLIPVRSVPQILPGTFQAQLQAYVTSLEIV